MSRDRRSKERRDPFSCPTPEYLEHLGARFRVRLTKHERRGAVAKTFGDLLDAYADLKIENERLRRSTPTNFEALRTELALCVIGVEALLWQAQLENYPNSKRVTRNEAARNWPATPVNLVPHIDWWNANDGLFYPDEPERSIKCREYLYAAQNSFVLGTQRALLAAFSHPFGVFYTCGPEQKWRGFRYGVEGSQYLSGFPEAAL